MAAGDTLRLSAATSLTVVPGDGDRLEVEARYEPGGSPPPHHLNPAQDEHFEVLGGSMQVRLADADPKVISAGDHLDVPSGTPHSMWNDAKEPAVLKWVTTPAGRTEDWFRALDSIHKRSQEGEVDPQEYMGLLEEYADVFQLVLD